VLPVKTRGQIPLQIDKEIIHYNEISDRILDIGMNMWDILQEKQQSQFHSIYPMDRVIERYLFDEALFHSLNGAGCHLIHP
jgi:hypothetical protein